MTVKIVGRARFVPAVFLVAVLSSSFAARGDDVAAVERQFLHPSRDFATGPLWVWNDMLTDEQIRDTLRELAEQGVKQAFVHPRFGLMTPYLSDEWFRLWQVSLDEAKKLDMNIWIYDENSYPSGFAGGWMNERMPESRGQGLSIRDEAKPTQPQEDILGVYRVKESGYENLTAAYRKGEALPDGKYVVAHREWAQPMCYFGYRTYVDILRPGVTEKFLEITLEPYRQRFGDEFGKRIPGVFTDEAGYRSAGELPWSPGLPEAFEKRWGYSLLDHLPSLRRPLGDWKKVRHDFSLVLLDQFIEHWSKPYYEYCQKNHLDFTGHYFEHDWPDLMGVPDNLSIYPFQQRPAIDSLFNTFAEDTHHHLGDIRIVKELSSSANQCGRKRTLCEAYGAGGWDLRLEDMKRNGDWLYVGGVNTLNQHLSFITIRGARKQDCPQSFSYHAPWWREYRVLADYFARLSLALSSGEEINKILVIEPTTTVSMYQSDGATWPRLNEIGNAFFNIILDFSKGQVEYDLGSEDSLARWGAVEGNQLVLRQRKYALVVLPPNCETLRGEVADLLERFVAGGGKVICADAPPTLVEARPSDRWKALARKPGWKTIPAAEIRKQLAAECPESLVVPRIVETKGQVLHMRRQLGDGQILFVINAGRTDPAHVSLDVGSGSLTRWNAFDGSMIAVPTKDGQASFDLPLADSVLLCYSPKPAARKAPAEKPADVVKKVEPVGPIEVKPRDLNVLTLDFLDLTAGGETQKGIYFHKANDIAFKKNGMPRGNPWSVTIQFRDETLRHKFPAESGFEATYHFTIEEKVPASLEIVVERPDIYQITCNDKPVTARKGAWWLDKSFGCIDLGATAKVGENAVTLRVKPMTIYHEIEATYLRGDFHLKTVASGFILVPPKPLAVGAAWNAQGHPFYSAGVAYRQTFSIPELKGTYEVRLPRWYGSVASVSVNGKDAGPIFRQPWTCDVTKLLKPGDNEIEVVVIGTLKNLLGAHHAGPANGVMGDFAQSPETGPPPGEKYDTIGYGLFEPFVLEERN